MNQTQSQTSSPTVEAIISGVKKGIWQKDNRNGEPPPHTHNDIARHEPVQIAHNAATVDWNEIGSLPPRAFREMLGFEGNAYDVPELIEACHQASQEVENIDKRIRDFDDKENALLDQYMKMHHSLVFFNFGVLLIQDFAERIEAIHKEWLEVREYVPGGIPHPLTPIVRAWLQDQTAKHITREYDRKHPVAMLRSGSLGSIRDVVLDMEGVGQSPVITAESEKIEESQLVLFESDKDSIFPDILPYQQMWDGRSKKTTRGGAVSHGVRIADEAFFPIEKGELEVELKFDLGMLLRAYHPDLTEKQLTSNRGKYLKFIIEGLAQVQYIGWEYTENGKTGIWVPVKMPDNFMPSINSPNDFAVRLSVKLLETQTFNGMAIEKFPLRLTGKRSLPQRNALRASYWIFDHYGTTKKWGLADPKKPKVEERDETDGALLKDGRRLFDSRGKPLKNPYHPEAVPLLGREKNPAAVNRYPILSEKDLLFACYPLGCPQGERKKYIRRSETHFTALENEGFIEIDRAPLDGWRILPSKQHIRAHRGLRRAIKESKKKS